VEAVNRFTYLGSDVDSSGYCTPEILRRIGLATSIMSQLDRVWRQSRLSNTTKLLIYNSCVLSSLLDASEIWTLLKADIAKLEAFRMTTQRHILGIFWYEFVANVEVATFSQLPSINKSEKTLWSRQAYVSGCCCPPSPASLSPVGDNQVVSENAGWSRSPRAQGSLLMLGV